MKKPLVTQRGFTLVEILITLVVLVILLGLGVVSTTALQANARDEERETDISVIARSFEQRYKQGNTKFKLDVGGYFTPSASVPLGQGSYPGIFELQYAYGFPKGEFDPDSLTNGGSASIIADTYDIPVGALKSPGGQMLAFVCSASCQPAETQSQIEASFQTSGAYVDRYVYEPIDASGNICSVGFDYKRCTRFNLYWRDESGTIRKHEGTKWQ